LSFTRPHRAGPTDKRPVNPPDGSEFMDMETGQHLVAVGGLWVPTGAAALGLPELLGIWDTQNATLEGSVVTQIPSTGTVDRPFVQRGAGSRPTHVSPGWIRIADTQHLHFLNAEDVIGASGYLALVAENIVAPTVGNQILLGGLGDNPANNAFNAGFLNQVQSQGGNVISQIRDSGGAKQASSGVPSGRHFYEMRWNGTISQIRRDWGSWIGVSAGSPTNLNQVVPKSRERKQAAMAEREERGE
jgi:hypothetical protein